MNTNTRANRAARRVRTVRELLPIIRDTLQEAEAELYIDGAIRNVDEANALTSINNALVKLEHRTTNLMMLLSDIDSRAVEPGPLSEFDNMTTIAKSEGIFRDSQ